jgi:LacI family transcriptional regulator
MARTVAEIGRLAGCSSATVSRAINNSGSVGAETRAAVMKALEESQYLVRRAKRRAEAGLRTNERETATQLVEVVLHRRTPMERLSLSHGQLAVGPLTQVRDESVFSAPYQLANSFYRRIIDGAVEEVGRWRHRAVLQNSGSLLNPSFISIINRPDRDGILLLGEEGPDVAAFVEQCRHPVVLVDLIFDGWPDVITSDNLAGIATAFGHLYSLGHRKIGFVGKFDGNAAFAERFAAYRLQMAEHGLPLVKEWIYEGPNHIDRTAAGASEILARPDRPSALLCVNDFSALGVVRAASKAGISIPKDLSVIGFDDEDAAAVVTPALTTMRVPMAEMGRQAVRQLMIQIQGGPTPRTRGCRVRLAPELIVRQSTGPAAN